ncbi:hypothetical protein Hypma_002928, partial [Hypsizygus marmoreus]
HKHHRVVFTWRIYLRSSRKSSSTISQSHLFADIYLDEHVLCKRLHSVLTENTSIAPHIHKLTVSLYQYTGFTDDEVLPLIFDMMASLRIFTLSGNYQSTWMTIPAHTQSAIFRIFSLPTLLTIRLICVFDIPITFFQIPKTLENLILDDFSFDGLLDLDNPPSLFFRSLQLGSLPHDTTRSAIMLPNSCFSQMSDLCSKLTHHTRPTLVHVLKTSARSLTSLKLIHTYTRYASPGENMMLSQFRLPGLANLKFISFNFEIHYSSPTNLQHNGDVVIQQLISFLAANADAMRYIERFTMTFTPLTYRGIARDDRRMPNILRDVECWNDLDKAIKTRCVRRGLRVRLVLIVRSSQPSELVDRRNKWQECMLMTFPPLRERGALALDIEDALSSVW